MVALGHVHWSGSEAGTWGQVLSGRGYAMVGTPAQADVRVACTADGQCPSGHCDAATYRCVECSADAHCPVARPICDFTAGSCVAG